MTVLTIIGTLVAIFIVYILVMKFNSYTYKKYNYEFFEVWSFTLTSISYALLYFGNNSYETAALNNGDILNGQLLMLFGIIGLIILLSINLSKTGFIVGVFGTSFQLVIYAVLAVGVFFVLIALLGFFSQTKPVISINSRD